MTRRFTLFFSFLCLALLLIATDDAFAKRFGGGRSFGSRPSYSKSYSSPTKQQSATRQPGQTAARPRSGMWGLFGGLLAGGLLGSMLFGGGFSGIGFMDILLIGGGIWLLMRFLRSRRTAQETGPSMYGTNRFEEQQTTNNAWDHLRTPAGGGGSQAGTTYPPGFDEHEFLEGAKAAFTRLQRSWDTRDLSDIRQFTSDEVYGEIERQSKEDPTPGQTDILLLQAFLQDVRTSGNQTVATVLFEATIREERNMDRTEEVREAWHFSRYETGGDSHWVVEGLQQTA